MGAILVRGAARLDEGTSCTFQISVQGRSREGFVIRHRGQLLSFVNECPHWAVELDLGDGNFYDPELDRIYCKNHGALFVLPGGECETGPCLGRQLTRLSLREEGSDVWVSP
jgi:nitrite reductase/ring-hydroxylating ferredoxin subunit